MKKTIAIVACAALMLIVGKANAQTSVNCGYTPSTISITNGNAHDTISLQGVAIGINQNVTLSGNLDLSVGLQARYGFASYEKYVNLGLLGTAQAKVEYSQFSLDIPVLLNYAFNIGDNLYIRPFAGPTLSYALTGNTHSSGSASVLNALNLSADGDDDWYDEGSDNSRFDVGVTFGVNVTINQFYLYGGYNLGLLNLSTDDNTTRKAAGLFFGVGYCL